MSTRVGSRNHLLRAALFLFSGVFVISIQDVIIKWISGDYPVHEIVLIRSIAGIVPLLILAHFSGGMKVLRTQRFRAHALRALLMFATYTAFYLSLAALPLAECVTLFFSAPLFITIFSSILLDERVDTRCWISVVSGLAGVILMLKPNMHNVNPAGLLAVLSALCYALGSIITRKLGDTENGVALAFYPTLLYIVYAAFLGGVLNRASFNATFHPSMAFLLHEWRMPMHWDLFWMVLLGLMMAAAFFCLSQAYRSVNPAVIAPLEYIAVPLSVGWGYLFWHEILDGQAVLAILVIIGSGLYLLGRETLLGARNFLNGFRIKIRR